MQENERERQGDLLPDGQEKEEMVDLDSYVGEPAQSSAERHKVKKSKKRLIASIVIGLFSVLFIAAGSMVLYANSLLSGYHYVPDEPESSSSMVSQNPNEESGESSQIVQGEAYKKDGLYHDDQVLNILLLGVDDYQPNDVGRSDSMMLISLDKRHQAIKVTSFMRDMYLSIPGYANNRINVAYSLGGAPLLVKTIEKNFGVDIDK